MSFVREESIKVVGNALGYSLDHSVASALVPAVEFRIRDIIQEATKFMQHSKRAVLSTHDINRALRLRGMEGIYGFSTSADPLVFRQALSGRSRKKRALSTDPGAKAEPGASLFYVEDEEVSLKQVVVCPTPSCPHAVRQSQHWIAVSGVQPQRGSRGGTGAPAGRKRQRGRSAGNGAPYPGSGGRGVTTVAAAVFGPGASAATGGGGAVVERVGGSGSISVLRRPPLTHSLPEELQIYFRKATSALLSGTPAITAAALRGLARDAGLGPALPHFTRFIAKQVKSNLRRLPVLRTLMRTVKALLLNPHLQLHPYLHQLMPSVLSCVVSSRLSASPSHPHWSLRDDAATLVAHCCAQFRDAYPDLQPRITLTLTAALSDGTKSIATQYGAVRTVAALGPRVSSQLLTAQRVAAMLQRCAAAARGATVAAATAAATPKATATGGALDAAAAAAAQSAMAAAAAAAQSSADAGHLATALLAAVGDGYRGALPLFRPSALTTSDRSAAAHTDAPSSASAAADGSAPGSASPSPAATAPASVVAAMVFQAHQLRQMRQRGRALRVPPTAHHLFTAVSEVPAAAPPTAAALTGSDSTTAVGLAATAAAAEDGREAGGGEGALAGESFGEAVLPYVAHCTDFVAAEWV